MIERIDFPGRDRSNSARAIGALLRDELTNHDVRFFSPDETTSNKLDQVFAATDRAWQLPIQPWDKWLSKSGRNIDLLSENTLFSLAMGYNLTGRQSWLASYEAFLPIITSQLAQYQKFLTQSREVAWRQPVKSLNLLSTSVCWRQDHNGYSHQNPGLIAELLLRPGGTANCYFPIDDVAAVACFEQARDSYNVVSLITFSKTDEPRWIDSHHAAYQLQTGASICQFASDPEPDMTLVGIGDLVSREALYGLQLVQDYALRVRFVNIAALSHNAIGTASQPLSQAEFNELFADRPIIANFHGYPNTLVPIFSHYGRSAEIHGYSERGSTTTPLDMLVQNNTSRYDIAIALLKTAARVGKLDQDQCAQAVEKLEREITAHTKYIIKHGVDREKDSKWQWQKQEPKQPND